MKLTNEDISIAESTRNFAATEILRFQNEKYYGTVPRELFKAFGAHGLCSLSTSEEFGGTAAGPVTIALVLEEIARLDLGCAIFLSVHLMVSGLINKFGTSAQRKKYLPKLASGEWLGAFALTEPGAGSDAANLSSQAKKVGNDYILNGEKCYITSAGFADLYVTFAKNASLPATEKGAVKTAFIVEAGTPGLSIGKPEKKMGAELSPIASLTFADLKLAAEQVLGDEARGYGVALGGLAGGRINIAACANGISATALELALKHLEERKQFGQPLIEFQGLQFMVADMKMKLEAARALTWQAAITLQNEPDSPKNRIEPSIAKCFATDAAMAITTDAVQLLGGAGYLKEYRVEQLMRDAKMLQIVEGTNQIQRGVIAREMRAQRGF